MFSESVVGSGGVATAAGAVCGCPELNMVQYRTVNGSKDLLFGRSELRREILRYLFSGAEREAHPSELARILDYTPQAVARELRRLEDLGIVASEQVGRAVRYRVDGSSPLFPEIEGLVAKTIGLEAVLRRALDGLSRVEEAFIFGSHASGDERPDSDVDVLVVGDPDQEALTDRLAEVEQRTGRDINVVTYAPEELRRLREAEDPFIADVFAGPRIVLVEPEAGE